MLRLSAWQSTCCSEAIQHHLGPLKHNYAYLPIVTGYIAKELGIRWQYHISCFVLCNMLQDTKGIITTLGRDGSDLTATVIGAAVKAAEVQIWKDVSGVQTTDPRVISSAKPATWSCWVGELWCCKNLFSHLDEVTNSVMERLYNWSWQWHGPSKLKYSKCWALSFLCLDLMVNQPRCECWHSKKPPSCRPLVQRLCTPLQCFLLGKPECQWACGIPWRRKIQVSLVFSVSAVLAVWTTDVILTWRALVGTRIVPKLSSTDTRERRVAAISSKSNITMIAPWLQLFFWCVSAAVRLWLDELLPHIELIYSSNQFP